MIQYHQEFRIILWSDFR